MDNQLAPNKTGNQFGRLDPSSTGFDQMAGNTNMMGMAPQMYPGQNGMAFQGAQMPMRGMGAGMGMQSMMQGGPVVPALVNAAGPQFDAVSDAILAAIKTEEKLVVSLPGAFGQTVPYSLTETDFSNIINEIRTQEASA